MLKHVLLADLYRQFELEGKPEKRPTLTRLMVRLLHYRFFPIALYRSARAAFLWGVPLLPHILTYLNIVIFGLEISPRCEIGTGLFFPHTYGTVIGASKIGHNATIFQGVTLGAKEIDMTFDPALRPTLGDNVIVGSGAKVLGSVQIGNGVVIGANAVVVKDVPPGLMVIGVPARPAKSALNENVLNEKKEDTWNSFSI